MGNPATYESIKPISLVVGISTRDGTLATDSYIKNGYVDATSLEPCVVKRPGQQALCNFRTGVGMAGGTPVALPHYQVQSLYGTQSFYGVVMGDHYLAFAPAPGGGAPYAITSNFSLVSYNYARGSYRAMGFLSGSGLQQLLQGPQTVLAVGGVAPIVLPINANVANYLLVPSFCELDETWYIMDLGGVIWASALGSPLSTWPVLNFVQAFTSGATPVALWKHLSYLIAFSNTSCKFYYDAAISPGAPIAQVMSAGAQIGIPLTGAFTLQSIGDETYFLGKTLEAGLGVYKISGLTPQLISPPGVNRILQSTFQAWEVLYGVNALLDASQQLRSAVVESAGHTFYLLTCPTVVSPAMAGRTIVYDVTAGKWYWWAQFNPSTGLETEMRLAEMLPGTGSTSGYAVDATSGDISSWSPTVYSDLVQQIHFEIQTDSVSWGSRRTKMIPATYLSADLIPCLINISWTNDDYGTFSVPQSVQGIAVKKQLIRCGSAIQRAWKISHVHNTPMRFYQLEVEVIPGAL